MRSSTQWRTLIQDIKLNDVVQVKVPQCDLSYARVKIFYYSHYKEEYAIKTSYDPITETLTIKARSR